MDYYGQKILKVFSSEKDILDFLDDFYSFDFKVKSLDKNFKVKHNYFKFRICFFGLEAEMLMTNKWNNKKATIRFPTKINNYFNGETKKVSSMYYPIVANANADNYKNIKFIGEVREFLTTSCQEPLNLYIHCFCWEFLKFYIYHKEKKLKEWRKKLQKKIKESRVE